MADSSKTSDPGGEVEITILQAIELPKLGFFSSDDKFRVQLSLGATTATTKHKRRGFLGDKASWNQPFSFTFDGDMPNLTLKVLGKTASRSDFETVGRATLSYAELSAGDPPEIGITKSYDLPLSDKEGNAFAMPKTPTLSISVKFIRFDNEKPVDDLAPLLKQAADVVNGLKGPNILGFSLEPGIDGDAATRVATDAGSILGAMGKFADIMDKLSEIHPYAKLAWDILDLSRKLIAAQVKEDDDIRNLYKQMDSLLKRIETFISKLDEFTAPGIHKDENSILRGVVKTSRECAEFITNHCKGSFSKRVVKSALSDEASQQIQNFKSAFISHEHEFNNQIWDGTSLVAHQILEKLLTAKIESFKVQGALLGASNKRSCLKGTRTAVLKQITDWIQSADPDVPRILWLSGMAGTGKSTIAHTIAKECREKSRLGAFFAFNRSDPSASMAKNLFPHIAASLTRLYPMVRRGFSDPEKKEVVFGSDIEEQLKTLIVEMSSQNTPSGMILIGVDALDEADDDREEVCRLLAQHCGRLPSNVRILLTSRPELPASMDTTLSSAFKHLRMPDSNHTMSDVRAFVQDELLPRNLKDITQECCDILSETSQGLFQWAATACKEIVGDSVQMGSTPYRRYEMVVKSGVGRDKAGLLDSLYKDILNRACHPDKNPDGYTLLQKVMPALFVLKELMTLDDFRRLYVAFNLGEASDVDDTLPYIASILDGINDRTRLVQPHHTSLRDFFLDPKRSQSFCVKDDLSKKHDLAARGSFAIVLTSMNQYNDVDYYSGKRREAYRHQAERMYWHLSMCTKYATLYWVKHLAEAPTPDQAFWIGMETSFLADDCVLSWITAFSLLVRYEQRDPGDYATPELNGSMGLLAHITKRQDSTCPSRVQSIVEYLSRIIEAEIDPPFHFKPWVSLGKLWLIARSVPWMVELHHQPKDGPSVAVGIGSVIHGSIRSDHDVILTSAHILVDASGEPRADLVLHTQIPQGLGWRAKPSITSIPPSNIHVCADFHRRRQLETDWGAILFSMPRLTQIFQSHPVPCGFGFDMDSRVYDILGLGTYGQRSWIPLLGADLNTSVDLAPPDRTSDVPVTRLGHPVASGAPLCSLGPSAWSWEGSRLYIRGISNPRYGNEAYTELTQNLIGELFSWTGVSSRNVQIRWRLPDFPFGPPKGIPEDDTNEDLIGDDCYFYVNEEEDSRLYLKRGSGSIFNIYPANNRLSRWSLVFGTRLVVGLEKDNGKPDNSGRLAVVSAPDHEGAHGLLVYMHRNANWGGWDRTLKLQDESVRFDVDSTPIVSPAHGELFEISLRDSGSEVKPGSTRRSVLAFSIDSDDKSRERWM